MGMKVRWIALAAAVLLTTAACSGGEPAAQKEGEARVTVVKTIAGQAELKQVLEEAGDRLVLLDLFAEWCGPCKALSPILEEIAVERADQVSVYKVDIDRNPAIAREFQVSGIPLIVFVKKGQRVHAIMGLNPKATYLRDIDRFVGPARASRAETPEGEQVDGIIERGAILIDVRTPNWIQRGHPLVT
jgi:thioredoxin 1